MMPAKPFRIIAAPSILGLWPSGVERLPEALLAAGLAARLGVETGAKLQPPPYDDRRDPATLMRNPGGIAAFSRSLAGAVTAALDAGTVPLVLGGDCSILIGNALALRRRGRFGLLFLDGHADFYQPAASPGGEAADMDLALVTGRGPEIVTRIDGFEGYFRDADVALLGFRDAEQFLAAGSQDVRDSGILCLDLAAFRRLGASAAAAQAMARLARPELAGFWIHLDVDVLDDAVMPAVDYRMPGGLGLEELATVLRMAVASGRCIGLDVTIFNPRLDPDGRIAGRLVDCLADSLGDCRGAALEPPVPLA